MSTQLGLAIPMTVTVKEHCRGIPVDGLPLIHGLLVKFMSGGTSRSYATTAKLPGEIVVGLTLAQISEGGVIPFLKHLFDEMADGLREHGRYRKDYDYNGQGPFLKTTVEVYDLKGEDYVPNGFSEPLMLGLNAAYVGSKVEDGLAAAAGIQQGLQWSCVELTLPADGPKAVIDIAAIMQPLRAVLEIPNLPAERIAEQMIPADKFENLAGVPIKMVDGEVQVSLRVDSLSLLPTYKCGENLHRDGAVIHSLRSNRWETKETGEFARLRVNVTVSSLNYWRGNDWANMPVLHPAKKMFMRMLTQQIAAAYTD